MSPARPQRPIQQLLFKVNHLSLMELLLAKLRISSHPSSNLKLVKPPMSNHLLPIMLLSLVSSHRSVRPVLGFLPKPVPTEEPSVHHFITMVIPHLPRVRKQVFLIDSHLSKDIKDQVYLQARAHQVLMQVLGTSRAQLSISKARLSKAQLNKAQLSMGIQGRTSMQTPSSRISRILLTTN